MRGAYWPVVRAGEGMVEPGVAREMVERQPHARLVELQDAGHAVHLDRPDEWRETLGAFLDTVDGATA